MPVAKETQAWRNYDKSMVDWIRRVRFEGYPVLCVFATPDRAFGAAMKQVKNRGVGKRDITRMADPIGEIERQSKEVAQTEPQVVPLPFISLGRISEAYDPKRFIRCFFNNVIGYTVSGPSGPSGPTMTWSVKRPLPWNLTYQVDVWGRDLLHVDDIKNQILLNLQLGEGFYLQVQHPYPSLLKLVWTTLNNVTDTSTLESLTKNRVLRKTLTFTVHGWLCYPPVFLEEVQTMDLDPYFLYDQSTLEDALT